MESENSDSETATLLPGKDATFEDDSPKVPSEDRSASSFADSARPSLDSQVAMRLISPLFLLLAAFHATQVDPAEQDSPLTGEIVVTDQNQSLTVLENQTTRCQLYNTAVRNLRNNQNK
ncbi:hypothetical protein SI65_06978 [Aspergillus cristatus]|uniref:Uncharacterized protein n=1 Tax=Aspergillus cristatus TaxID=573508 RepID=A0A1E3B8K4_ASPCR|nr:hypothetical protein SI65_06978 [Aspergillus cristatus]